MVVKIILFEDDESLCKIVIWGLLFVGYEVCVIGVIEIV